MKRWIAIVPIAGLFGLAALGAAQLMNPEKGDFVRETRQAPDRVFETFASQQVNFGAAHPEARIVNLFASWCAPCRAEHNHLIALNEAYPGKLYGILYKDTRDNGETFLTELGNPFTDVAIDLNGQGGLDFGLTGVPETFVISPEGEILLHIDGPLSDETAKKVGETLESASP